METIAGRGKSPALVLLYVQALPDNSLTHAFRDGGWEHYGWGQDRHLLADIFDGLTFNTEATAHWDKPPKLPRWPRPTSTAIAADSTTDAPKKPATVASLYGHIQKQR